MNVAFVVPFRFATSLRFLHGALAVPGARVALISQDPLESFGPAVAARLAAHHQVKDALDPRCLVEAVRSLEARRPAAGRVQRLLGVLEQLQVPLADARAALGIGGAGALSPDAARNFRDKPRMKDRLRAAGLPCARHRLCASRAEVLEFVRATGLPVVVKPPAGAGAVQTFRVNGPGELEEALARFPPAPQRPALVEEFIQGEEHSFDAVLVDGRPVFTNVSRYAPAPLTVLENDWIQWTVLLPRRIDGPEYAGIHEQGVRALRVLGLETGVAHLEWFRRPDGGMAISEAGARPPGAQFTSLMSHAHDADLYRAFARLMVCGEFLPVERRCAVGAAYLRGQGSGRVRAVHGLDQAQRELGDLVVEARLPQPGQAPSGGYEGEGYVILKHPETAVVARALERLVALVRVELR